MIHRPQPLPRSIKLALLASGLALTAATAFAQERSPYYIGASQAFTRDSNLYRTPTNEISDTVSSTGILAGLDQPIGRQRLYGDVSAQVNRYNREGRLNNNSYALTAGLDWETVGFLSGTLRYNIQRGLADFASLEGSVTPSEQTTKQLTATVRYGLTSRVSLDAGYEARRLDYASAAFADRNLEQDTVSAGIRWGGSGSALVLGLGVRAGEGRSPQFSPVPPYEDEFKRRDVDLLVTWTPSPFSTVNGRLSATKETHSIGSAADVSGLTGSLSWDYRPTAKLGLIATIGRETGTESIFTSTSSDSTGLQRADRSRINNTAQLEARYAATSKISLSADTRWRDGRLASGGDETVTGYGIGIRYEPTRSIILGCNAGVEKRDAQAGAIDNSYSATTTHCSAQILLR